MKVDLSLDTIGDLDGGVARVLIDSALRAAVRDTEDRGDDEKVRKVTIEVLIEKANNDHIAATLTAKPTLPPYRTKATIGELHAGDGRPVMRFSTASPGRPDQPSIPETH